MGPPLADSRRSLPPGAAFGSIRRVAVAKRPRLDLSASVPLVGRWEGRIIQLSIVSLYVSDRARVFPRAPGLARTPCWTWAGPPQTKIVSGVELYQRLSLELGTIFLR